MQICSYMTATLIAVFLTACRPAVDVSAERAALDRVDREWATVAGAGSDIDRIVSYWADDARVYPLGMPVVSGKTAIREFVAASLKVPGFSVTWTPEHVEISPDGMLGYSIGTNRFTAADAKGHVVATPGRYVTVWRKQSDGSWKCVVDIWNVGAAS